MDSQMMMTALLLLGLGLGFLFYPGLMFRAIGSLLRGVFSLLADGVALLFAWL